MGDHLLAVLAALANPHRLRVIAALSNGGRNYISQLCTRNRHQPSVATPPFAKAGGGETGHEPAGTLQ